MSLPVRNSDHGTIQYPKQFNPEIWIHFSSITTLVSSAPHPFYWLSCQRLWFLLSKCLSIWISSSWLPFLILCPRAISKACCHFFPRAPLTFTCKNTASACSKFPLLPTAFMRQGSIPPPVLLYHPWYPHAGTWPPSCFMQKPCLVSSGNHVNVLPATVNPFPLA